MPARNGRPAPCTACHRAYQRVRTLPLFRPASQRLRRRGLQPRQSRRGGPGHACQRLREDGVEGILATVITMNGRDGGPPGPNRRYLPARHVDTRGGLRHSCRSPVHQPGLRLRRGPSGRGSHPPDAGIHATAPGRRRWNSCAWLRSRRCDSGMKVIRHLVGGHFGVGGPLRSEFRRNPRRSTPALSMSTHLGNGCPVILHRHDNMIQRVLGLHDRLNAALSPTASTSRLYGYEELPSPGRPGNARSSSATPLRGVEWDL